MKIKKFILLNYRAKLVKKLAKIWFQNILEGRTSKTSSLLSLRRLFHQFSCVLILQTRTKTAYEVFDERKKLNIENLSRIFILNIESNRWTTFFLLLEVKPWTLSLSIVLCFKQNWKKIGKNNEIQSNVHKI